MRKLKFIYSGKATKFCEISIVDLSYVCSASQIYGGDLANVCGLLRIHELYVPTRLNHLKRSLIKLLKMAQYQQSFSVTLHKYYQNCNNKNCQSKLKRDYFHSKLITPQSSWFWLIPTTYSSIVYGTRVSCMVSVMIG